MPANHPSGATTSAPPVGSDVTKTDQEGTKNVDHPWHVYSNPECPEICAHLTLARLLMYNTNILNGQTALFEGRAQYKRFNRIFRDIVSHPNHCEEFAELGITYPGGLWDPLDPQGRRDTHLDWEHGVSAYRIDLSLRKLGDVWRARHGQLEGRPRVELPGDADRPT